MVNLSTLPLTTALSLVSKPLKALGFFLIFCFFKMLAIFPSGRLTKPLGYLAKIFASILSEPCKNTFLTMLPCEARFTFIKVNSPAHSNLSPFLTLKKLAWHHLPYKLHLTFSIGCFKI